MAIAFFWGDPFAATINDPKSFTITMQLMTKYKNVSKNDTTLQIPLSNCFPDWIPELSLPMLCPPDNISLIMHGLLYATETYTYPRFSISYCKPGGQIDCLSTTELFNLTSGGRMLLYVKNTKENINYQKQIVKESTPYTAY